MNDSFVYSVTLECDIKINIVIPLVWAMKILKKKIIKKFMHFKLTETHFYVTVSNKTEYLYC